MAQGDNIKTSSVHDVVHYFHIKVFDLKREKVETLSWSGLVWDLRLKYDWYFKYRAALLQVKYPRFKVETSWGNVPAEGKTLERIRQNKIKSKKATITKYKNRLNSYKQEFEDYKSGYTLLFPIESELLYQKFVASIDLAESKIKRLENELHQM